MKVTANNFIYCTRNKHSEGFPEGLYYLADRQTNFIKPSVVLIKYDHKNFLLNNDESKAAFYPVIKFDKEFNYKSFISNKNENSIIFKTKTNKQEYIKRVNLLKQHIQQGDIYEINYCIEFFAEDVDINEWTLFDKVNKLSEAPYTCLAKLDDEIIISASPELFLRKNNDVLETKPIKGTIKRSADKGEDEQLKQSLRSSIKEQTENVMIVDVARNDLSVIAQKASVVVNKLFAIESFKTVHQMVSTVSCKVKQNLSFGDIIQATFPMPSMTGAPKIRAMELIDEYEQFNRNNYSGSIGIINEDNSFVLSVLIRSVFYNIKTKRLSISVGSAITHLCNPESEYEECLLKAEALLKALNGTIQE